MGRCFYDDDVEGLHEWVRLRAAKLRKEWKVSAYNDLEFECIIDDAIDKQARAERLAYVCGRPIPDAKIALAELVGLLEWMGGGQAIGGVEALPEPPEWCARRSVRV